MKIRCYGRLHTKERLAITEFCEFVLTKFVSAKKLKTVDIIIRFINPTSLGVKDGKELSEYSAWMYNLGNNQFEITIDSTLCFFDTILECIGHELSHIKQYVLGELRDKANGDVWYKGECYTDWESGENYYFSPWEIEAYGLETSLYKLFMRNTG